MNAVTPLEPDAARDEAWSLPLEDIDVSDPVLHKNDTIGFYFDRLREECRSLRPHGAVWRLWSAPLQGHHGCRYEPCGLLVERPSPFATCRRIPASKFHHDGPAKTVQRKAVSPIVAPANLARMESTIRERTQRVLDGLPVNEEFDWVEHVSIELTTLMLATLFDFPLEDRKLLTYWSDVATVDLTSGGPIDTDEKRIAELTKCLEYFTGLWNERVNEEPRPDLISMMSHADHPTWTHEFLGNLILLIVGGNDTTRNSMSGSIVATNRYPDEDRKVRANPELIASSFVPEIIRWQTPLAHMRRTVKEDTAINGQPVKAGDKVIMWYLSGNRDADAIEDPYAFIADHAHGSTCLSASVSIAASAIVWRSYS